jgi:hypothetical protein
MPITIRELGLERGVVAAWSEPRAGQRLKPRFGTRRFPKKILYALLMLTGYIGFVAFSKGDTPSLQQLILWPLIAVGIAWPLLIGLDRLSQRNVWVYTDRILVTHGGDRVVLLKSAIKQIVVYQASNLAIPAMEFVTLKGQSTVVALPDTMNALELLTVLANLGFAIRNDL